MIDQEPRDPIPVRRAQQRLPPLRIRAEPHPGPGTQLARSADGFVDDAHGRRVGPDVVSEEASDVLHGVRLVAAEVGPDEVDDVGPSVEGGVDGPGALVRPLGAGVEFGDDEAVGGVVVLLVLRVGRWLDRGYVSICLDQDFLSHDLHVQCSIQGV